MIAATNQSLADAGIDDRPGRQLADAGYCSWDNLAALTEDDPDCLIATRTARNIGAKSHAKASRQPTKAIWQPGTTSTTGTMIP